MSSMDRMFLSADQKIARLRQLVDEIEEQEQREGPIIQSLASACKTGDVLAAAEALRELQHLNVEYLHK